MPDDERHFHRPSPTPFETTVCRDCGKQYPTAHAQLHGSVVQRDGQDTWVCCEPAVTLPEHDDV